MKLIIFLGVILGIAGCESSSLELPQAVVGSDINGPVKITTLVRDNEGLVSPFEVTVDSIRDGRCPSDVECLWAGIEMLNSIFGERV